MKHERMYLNIELKGDIFIEINDQYHMEQERMNLGDKMLSSKMGDIYMEVFKCNKKITLLKAECFGNIIIDDNHIVIEWDIAGCTVEFYYEQYWDLMTLTIGMNGVENALIEIAKSFQKYYKKHFNFHIKKINNSIQGYDGKPIEYTTYNLVIEE